MGRHTNYGNFFNKDYDEVVLNNTNLKKENKKLRLENSLLKDEIRRLNLELEKTKIHSDMDCTCSSIPSSKSGFKKGISNSRKLSNKSVGGQKNHKGHCLNKNKIESLLKDSNTKQIKIKLNYTKKSKDKQPIVRYKIGFEIKPVIYKYEIYPNEKGKYDIPKELQSQVQYSEEIKTLAMSLYYNCNVSTDNLTLFFNDLFNVKISKGTIVNWSKELEVNFGSETRNILKTLKSEKFLHADDTTVNVDGENYNIHNVSSKTHTMQWAHKSKGHKAIEDIGFLPMYNGTLIKDGTHVYDKYNNDFVSCGAHISRYLIGANKGVEHLGEENLLMFFSGLRNRRKKLLRKGYTKVDDKEYKNILIQYEFLLKCWHEEIKADKDNNPCYDDERKLQARLLQDEVQHLKFMTDFSLPYTNNRAETDLRYAKRRQCIGIFRNEEAADRYVTIKSCLSTYRKNKVNLFSAIQNAFAKKTIIV